MNNEIRTGLWIKDSKKGTKYMSGTLKLDGKEYYLTMFKNNKNNEKQPDYNLILRSKEQVEEKQEEKQIDAYEQMGKQVQEEIELDDASLPF
jgi:hypothetical protein